MLNIPDGYHLRFSDARNSVHTRRTMMLQELSMLLTASKAGAEREKHHRLILEENILHKQSMSNRRITAENLTKLYTLDPSDLVFSALRTYWEKEEQDRNLLALLCAYLNDHLLRSSWEYIKSLPEGSSPDKPALEQLLEKMHPGRYSTAVLRSTVRSLLSTWTQSGHLAGRRGKVRSRPRVGAASVSFALLLGYLMGERGQLLFSSVFTELLDCSLPHRYEMAQEASRRGMIIMKRIGDIIEVEFPDLLINTEKAR